MSSIKAVKGTKDILPQGIAMWQRLEGLARRVFREYGYQEIRTPIFEKTDLFLRSIGEGTDIVQKEMYTFDDPKGRSLTLRPEGTAPVVRAFLENHLKDTGSVQKLCYIGPMFRYERPQAGRMRQFHQIGIEALGAAGPALDAEVMVMLLRYLDTVGIEKTTLKINCLGSEEDRASYIKILEIYIAEHQDQLCGDCHTRIEKNILRVLDCKKKSCHDVVVAGPQINDCLGDEAKAHFETVKHLLHQSKVNFVEDPYLVRGLDYYSGVVFEVTCSSLGAQDAIAAGGRYDGLVKKMGGPVVPAVGFAFGQERLLYALNEQGDLAEETQRNGIYWACVGPDAVQKAFVHSEVLRQEGFVVQMDYDGRSLKAQLRYADKNKFNWLIVLGESELESGMYRVKHLETGEEQAVPEADLLAWFRKGIQ